MKNGRLIIIGASAMGREACAYAQEAGQEVGGFLDSRGTLLEDFAGYPPVLSSVNDYTPRSGDVFVCAIGDPAAKMNYVECAQSRGWEFASIVHPAAYVGKNVRIGSGCIICPGAVITNDAVIGDHVIVNVCASINHDNRIGEGCTLCPGVRLAGRVELGRNVFVGTGALLIPDVKLGDGVFVAAGATVTRSFASGRLMGVPAVER